MRFFLGAFQFLLGIYNRFNEHNGFLLSAGIAFFTFFSIFPLLILTGVILGYALEDPGIRNRIIDYALANLPVSVSFIRSSIERLITVKSSASLIAVLGLIWSGTGLFGSLAIAINAIYEVRETRNILWQRLLALLVFFIIISLLLISFGFTTIASVFRDEVLSVFFPERVAVFAWTVITLLISLASTLLLFLTVYWLAPNVRLTFRNIWLGTLAAGAAWQAANYGFAIYLSIFATRGYGFVYGSLATIVLFMFWLYISAVLLLVGAEINVAHRRRLIGGVKTFEPRKGSRADI